METRVAVLSIIVENEDAVGELNELLHRFGKAGYKGGYPVPAVIKSMTVIVIDDKERNQNTRSNPAQKDGEKSRKSHACFAS